MIGKNTHKHKHSSLLLAQSREGNSTIRYKDAHGQASADYHTAMITMSSALSCVARTVANNGSSGAEARLLLCVVLPISEAFFSFF